MAGSPVERISIEDAHARMRAQGVARREDVAFRCPICGTVQSIASLMAAGAGEEDAEKSAGFSCEGRVTGAGPWPPAANLTPQRRAIRGCDWTLGGLLALHTLEVVRPDGSVQPCFEIVGPAAAVQLAEELTQRQSTPDADNAEVR